MEQTFTKNELAETVEAEYGVKIRHLKKIATGAQSVNYTVYTDDGGKFVVKVLPSLEDARRTLSNCRCLEPANGVRCLFGGKIVELCGCSAVCLSYCDGDEVRFEQYDSRRLDELIGTYGRISSLLRSADDPHPARTVEALTEELREKAQALPESGIYRAVVDEILSDGIYRCRDDLRVVHGDFHYANFRYVPGKKTVAGIFDFMEFRIGYPAEDFVRLVLCSAERMRWYRLYRRRNVMAMFARLVSMAGYPSGQWESAINGYLLAKMIKYAEEGRCGMLFAMKVRIRLRLYRRLKSIARNNGRV
jgi:Ser/Thr protein kinase RdoA (MazF antagonist)